MNTIKLQKISKVGLTLSIVLSILFGTSFAYASEITENLSSGGVVSTPSATTGTIQGSVVSGGGSTVGGTFGGGTSSGTNTGNTGTVGGTAGGSTAGGGGGLLGTVSGGTTPGGSTATPGAQQTPGIVTNSFLASNGTNDSALNSQNLRGGTTNTNTDQPLLAQAIDEEVSATGTIDITDSNDETFSNIIGNQQASVGSLAIEYWYWWLLLLLLLLGLIYYISKRQEDKRY